VSRRTFNLPQQDAQYLDSLGHAWEAVQEGSYRWLLVHDINVPGGYTVPKVTLALMIPPGYPDAAMDMAWVFPALQRMDGIAVPTTEVKQQIDGRAFQRWSRHRTQNQEWRPGIDDIGTHLAMAREWFAVEFNKRPH
jgi:hypothetical protein